MHFHFMHHPEGFTTYYSGIKLVSINILSKGLFTCILQNKLVSTHNNELNIFRNINSQHCKPRLHNQLVPVNHNYSAVNSAASAYLLHNRLYELYNSNTVQSKSI